jgi:hypothetical protein
MLGLAAGDNIDGLLVLDSATVGAGIGSAPGGSGRTFGPHPTDFIGFSLAPGSPSLAPASPLPAVCAPGAKTPGDIWGVSPSVLAGAPFALMSAESLGLCSVRVAACGGVNDNLDALEISWPMDADADNAPDAVEGACGALVGPADTDVDGLPDSIEIALSTNLGGFCVGFPSPAMPDSDLDGMPDGWEIAYWSAMCPATNPSVPDGPGDFDGEGVPNIGELAQFTSPCDVDTDGDGFADLAASLHSAPANASAAVDNCPNVPNPGQLNNDGNLIDLSPPKAFDDSTLAMSDAMGNDCDPNDDNDGLTDVDEASGAACGGIVTSATLRDTDGDRLIDGAECGFLALNPTVINGNPAACSVAGDPDGDGILSSRELCYYGTDPSLVNSDGDACNDGREMASVNAPTVVDVLDLAQVAGESGAYVSPGSSVKVNYDVTKNGSIDVIDLSQVAARAGICP